MDMPIDHAPAAIPARSVIWPRKLNQIPKEVFVSPELFEDELKTIYYGNIWHPVAHVAEIPNIGDFKTFALGRTPLLITRGADGKVNVLVNSCTHRGTQVEMCSAGNRQEFECPYHRWAFGVSGELIGCPGMNEFSPGFDKSKYGLTKLRTAEFLGVVFATMGEATPPLEQWLGENMIRTMEVILGDGRLKLLGYQKVRYQVNWKAYNDNDGYHAGLLHAAFRLLNWQGGKGKQFMTENGHMSIMGQLQPLRNVTFLKDPSLVTFKGQDPAKGSSVIELFPIGVMVKHLDTINVRFAIAHSHDCTEVHYAYFAHEDDDETMVQHRIRQASNLLGPCGMVSMEDASIFQRIHIGSFSPGVVEFQKGVKDFYHLPEDVAQNDETGQLPKWEYYRKLMNFQRAEI
jgi:phenylpropionate dioxygenase-like ring-hydroxylating dioxygenase large terminal subunit